MKNELMLLISLAVMAAMMLLTVLDVQMQKLEFAAEADTESKGLYFAAIAEDEAIPASSPVLQDETEGEDFDDDEDEDDDYDEDDEDEDDV